MLPGGVLSKHGYTVKWGFFSGVCGGSHQQPFELSKDLIAGAVANIEKQIKEVSAEIAELENLDSEINGKDTAQKHNYNSYLGYIWETVKVVEFEGHNLYHDEPTMPVTMVYSAKALVEKKSTDTKEPKPDRIETYSESFNLSSVRHFVWYLNCKYAKHLRQQNSSRRDWINWQTGRLANWAVQPLKERGAK